MTLNSVMAITLRYFTEFGKPALQKTICGGITVYTPDACVFRGNIQFPQFGFDYGLDRCNLQTL